MRLQRIKNTVCMGAWLGLAICLGSNSAFADPTRWSVEQARQWQADQGWKVGSNYITSSAVNALEMWQEGTFDPDRIDLELGWAQNLGMSTVRVFLHDLAWQQDQAGFLLRLGNFLEIADRHRIRPVFVFFDSCWNPAPHTGQQPAPTPGVHNSQWVQSPGLAALSDPSQYPRLKDYVQGVLGVFGNDPRILAWDLWNEPDNLNIGSYNDPVSKLDGVLLMLPQVFAWAREMNPTQPLTSGVWGGDWSSVANLSEIQKIQLDSSDIISFHNYGATQDFEQRITWLTQYGRPIVCTEYMARPLGSTFQAILPVAERYQVSAINWGMVAGKTQTYFPWDSWQHPYSIEPPLWFHDIFHADGTPYLPDEATFLANILGAHD